MNLKQSTVALALMAALPIASHAAPKISFRTPLAGGTMTGNVSQDSRYCDLTASTDTRRVVFWLDGNVQLNTEGSAPWNCNVDTRKYYDGAHKLKAVAYDSRGASTTTEITVNFANNNPAPSTGGTSGGTSGGTTSYSGTPYSGTPIALPKAFAAADFDRGGQNVSYKDASTGNQGGQYRTGEDVDIGATRDSQGVGAYDIVNFQTGEWLAYTVNVPASGKYDIAVRAANNYASPTAFHVEVDGVNVTGSVSVPKTGSWSTYQWVGKQGIDLAQGKRVIKVVADAEYFGLNGVSVLASASTGGGTTTPTQPTGGTSGGTTSPSGLSVAFDSPKAGDTVSTTLNQSTGCQVSGTGITAVEFSLDNTPLNREGSAPWQCNLDPKLFTVGAHTLKAKAFNSNGGSVETTVAINTTGGTTSSTGGSTGGSTGTSGGTKPAGMLFWSGFEGSIALGTPYDCYGNGCYQDLTGTDSLTQFALPPKINGGYTRFQMISNANSAPTPSTIGSYMYNQIQTVTGRTGAQTRALYNHIAQSGCCGTSPQGNHSTQDTLIMYPSSDVNEFYYSAWIKLQDDLAPKLLTGDPWRSFFAIKSTDTDWRLELYAVDWARTGRPQLMVLTDGYVPTRQEFWRVYGDPVPVGRWFKYEVYVKRSSGTDGRVWVAVDGKVLADKRGANYGGNRSPINRIMSTLLYSGSAYPIYQWVDDIQLWTTFPTAKAGDPWYDGVYAPR